MKRIDKYKSQLRAAIKARTGEDCPPWMLLPVQATAMQLVMLDKLTEGIEKGDLVIVEIGSQGQAKQTANPLLTAYKECQRTLTQQLTALGLTYAATPSKMTESTQKAGGADDPMAQWMGRI